jgi:PAT family beta-lactamase induction signal transducer AmpG
VLVLIGIAATLFATEPPKSAIAEREHSQEKPLRRILTTIVGAFRDFFLRDRVAIMFAALLFVVLFKLTDALAGVMTGPFTIDLGFSRTEYTTIVKGVGFAATLIGGFAGGYVAQQYSLTTSLWLGGVLQALANFAFCWQAVVGRDLAWLTFAITLENFTSAIGTVIFVAYLSALCRKSIQTATQYALLTALAAIGRIFIPAVAGSIEVATGWAWFFVICALAAIPGLLVLALLQYLGHFSRLADAENGSAR